MREMGTVDPHPRPSPRGRGRKSFTLARALGLGGVFLVLLFAAFLVAVRLGDQRISLVEALGDPSSSSAIIFWSVRLPRALLAALVGAGLAASGVTLQGVLRNPLADPFVLGVSGGAALGATLSLFLG